MSNDPLDTELNAIKQRALAGDLDSLRESYRRGELQWLQGRMTPERYAHLGLALDRGDLESVRTDLATVSPETRDLSNQITDVDDDKRSLFLQSQRNGLIAGAIVVALALLGLIGFLALRNDNDNASDTAATMIIVSDTTVSDTTVSDTTLSAAISPDTTTPNTLSTLTATSGLSETLPPSTVSAAPAVITKAPPTTVQRSVPAATTPAPTSAPPITAAGARRSDVLSAAERSSTFSAFLSMIEAAGLRDEIQTLNPSTVLAPTESAFSSLPTEVQAGLRSTANRAILARIVRYNVIPQAITLRQFTTSDLLTLEGSTLSVVVGNNKVVINDATVTGPDVLTITGVLHAIDKLLLPPGVSLNALVPKPVSVATLPPQTSPPATQPVSTASATQPPATSPPAAATTAVPAVSTTIASTTTKVP